MLAGGIKKQSLPVLQNPFIAAAPSILSQALYYCGTKKRTIHKAATALSR
jgi:hypothetical protein